MKILTHPYLCSRPPSRLFCLQVAWKEESNPSLGFDYLYLSEEDYTALPKGTVDAVAVIDKRTGETRWQLEAIIGQTHGIGVENLRCAILSYRSALSASNALKPLPYLCHEHSVHLLFTLTSAFPHLLHLRRGSGLIAGETSRAYDETFTLSYVTGRSVGIGAYLNR